MEVLVCVINIFLDLIYFQTNFIKWTCRIRVWTLENLKKEKGYKSFLETSSDKTEWEDKEEKKEVEVSRVEVMD